MPRALDEPLNRTTHRGRTPGMLMARQRLPLLAGLLDNAAVLVTIDDVALMLAVGTRDNIRARIALGEFPPPDVMLGRSARWHLSTVRRVMRDEAARQVHAA